MTLSSCELTTAIRTSTPIWKLPSLEEHQSMAAGQRLLSAIRSHRRDGPAAVIDLTTRCRGFAASAARYPHAANREDERPDAVVQRHRAV